MTDQEWRECTEPERMLEFLDGKISDRKLRLLLCASCRRVWYQLKDRQSRRAIETAERFADGTATSQELAKACQGAWDTWVNWPRIDALSIKAVCAATWVARPEVGPAEAARVLEYTLAVEARLPPEDASRDRSDLLRCLFGNPIHPIPADPTWRQWQDGSISKLAATIYEERRFEDLPVLADALEEAGCQNEEILRHCREPGEHVRGCWVLDSLLEKL